MSDPHLAILLDINTRIGRVEGQNDQILQEQGRAVASRERLHEKVDTIGNRLTACEGQIKSCADDVAELKPIVAALQARHHRSEGASALMGRFGEWVQWLWANTAVKIATSTVIVFILGLVGIKMTK